jgi:hypothetical protein
VVVLIIHSVTTYAQNLGHKVPGSIGLDAAGIPDPGLYLLNRFARYEADELRDRNGNVIPTGPMELAASANGFGVSYTTRISSATFLTMTIAGPIALVKTNVANQPAANLDRFGVGDPYIQPIRLGWRKQNSDLVASYGIYLPIDKSALAGGSATSSGRITHEFSGGATRYFKDRTWLLAALGSYELKMQSRGIDITRGDTVQIEGGAGAKLFGKLVETGLASYALWQVRDDRGTGVPPAVLGARDRVFGLGPEGAVLIKTLHAEVRGRYEWDFGVRSRPQGNILVVSIWFLVQHPKQPTP